MVTTSIMRVELAQTEATAKLRAEVLRQKGFEVTGPEQMKTVWVSAAKPDGAVDTLVSYMDEVDDGDDVVWVVTARKKKAG